jgi:hypothetical protein
VSETVIRVELPGHRTYEVPGAALDRMIVRHTPASAAMLRQRIGSWAGDLDDVDDISALLVVLAAMWVEKRASGGLAADPPEDETRDWFPPPELTPIQWDGTYPELKEYAGWLEAYAVHVDQNNWDIEAWKPAVMKAAMEEVRRLYYETRP